MHETVIFNLYWGCIGILEKKMETTIGFGVYRGIFIWHERTACTRVCLRARVHGRFTQVLHRNMRAQFQT